MSSIKELTQDLHTELESIPFNVKMFKGEQTTFERQQYVASWIPIFKVLDPHVSEPLRRLAPLLKAQDALGHKAPPALGSHGYAHYLTGWHQRNNRSLKGHIYLNYMGFLYGGQIMKKRYPESSQMYEFGDLVYWREYIRENYVDMSEEFVYEVKQGFRMHINICNELGRVNNVKMGDDDSPRKIA